MRCPVAGPPGETEFENLGPAIIGFPVNMAERIGDRLYLSSLSLNPSRVAEYDLSSDEVTHTENVPTGRRTWALTADGNDLYFGQWGVSAGEVNFYRYDTLTHELEELAAIDSRGEFWDLEVGPDGLIYAGTGRVGIVYTYDPLTGDIGEVEIDGADGQTNSLEIVGDTLYVSGGGLFELDLNTLEATDITPPEVDGGIYVNSVAATDDYVAFGTTRQEPANFIIMDRQDPTSYDVVTLDDDARIGAVAFTDDDVFFSGIVTGKLYRYNLQTGEVEHVATPVANDPTRRSFIIDDTLVGVSAAGVVWEYHLETGELSQVDLLEAGAEGAPEQPQSMAITPSQLVVGKNNGIQATPLDEKGDVERFSVPGEPKAMVTAGDDVYIALYPSGLLWRYNGEARTLEQVSSWDTVQNRPRVAHYHADLDRVLVGTSSDPFGSGGALVSYDPSSDEMVLFDRPFGDDTPVDSITNWGDQAVIGGAAIGDDADAPLSLIDPATGVVSWSTVPVPGGGNIVALVTDRDGVHGLTENRTVFTVDPQTGDVVRVVPDALAGVGAGEMLVHDKHLYAVTRQQLVKLPLSGADAFEPIVVADDLSSGSFNRPPLRRGPDCSLYVVTDLDLLQVRDDNRDRPQDVSVELGPEQIISVRKGDESAELTATVTSDGPGAATNVGVELEFVGEEPAGLEVELESAGPPTMPPNEAADWTWTLSAEDDAAEGLYSLRAVATFGSPDTWTSESPEIDVSIEGDVYFIDDTDNRAEYTGGWTRVHGEEYLGGGLMSGRTGPPSVTIEFDGSRAEYVALTSQFNGYGDVYVDDVFEETIDFYHESAQYQQVVFDTGPLDPGEHTVTVVGKDGHEQANEDYVNFDALVVYRHG